MNNHQHPMDRATARLREIHAVSGWLLRHWTSFPLDLFRQERNVAIPVDVRLLLLNNLQGDLTNLLTTAQQWRLVKQGYEQRENDPPESKA